MSKKTYCGTDINDLQEDLPESQDGQDFAAAIDAIPVKRSTHTRAGVSGKDGGRDRSQHQRASEQEQVDQSQSDTRSAKRVRGDIIDLSDSDHEDLAESSTSASKRSRLQLSDSRDKRHQGQSDGRSKGRLSETGTSDTRRVRERSVPRETPPRSLPDALGTDLFEKLQALYRTRSFWFNVKVVENGPIAMQRFITHKSGNTTCAWQTPYGKPVSRGATKFEPRWETCYEDTKRVTAPNVLKEDCHTWKVSQNITQNMLIANKEKQEIINEYRREMFKLNDIFAR